MIGDKPLDCLAGGNFGVNPILLGTGYGKEELENGKISGSKAQVSGHFVVVTGILSEKEELYYEISSWGRKYYMKRKDYEKLCRSHFLGNILGNILVITARKGLFRKLVEQSYMHEPDE